jgi:cell fate (sporulation/competence/biofilm development) regulator YlbF (YheA/YmcA/DUF963 family)
MAKRSVDSTAKVAATLITDLLVNEFGDSILRADNDLESYIEDLAYAVGEAVQEHYENQEDGNDLSEVSETDLFRHEDDA